MTSDVPLTPDEFGEVLRARGIGPRVIEEVVSVYAAHIDAAQVGGSA